MATDGAGRRTGSHRSDPLVAALLLTGGASRRMGRDKANLSLGDRSLAQRTGALLEGVVDLAIEVGPGRSGLDAIQEEPRGQGPLAAIVAGRRALRDRGHSGSALVIACDMPLLNVETLRFLAAFDVPTSVVPVVEGRAQPLCAKWGADDLDAASRYYAHGERSVRFLAEAPGVVLLSESQWSACATRDTFADADTPEDARRFGLTT